MTSRSYGKLAVCNVILCVILAIISFPAAAFGGFTALAIGTYVAIFASMMASFYLLAMRRELSQRALRRVFVFATSALLVVIAPGLLLLGWALVTGL